MTLAELITNQRGSRTDEDVAGELGVSQTTVSRWRRGVRWPEPENYEPLAWWLGVSFDDVAAMVDAERDAAGLKRSIGRAERLELERLIARMGATIATMREESRLRDIRTEERFARLEAALHLRSHRPGPTNGPKRRSRAADKK